MAEVDHEFASKGIANAGLTTGIIGTALGALNGGLLNGNGLFGGMGRNCGYGGMNYNGCGYGYDVPVSRYEAGMQAKIAEQDSHIKLLEADKYTDSKILDVYAYFDGKLKDINDRMCHQAIINTQLGDNIACMQRNLDVLNGLTKTVIPIDSICPAPMPQFNSWTAPTATAAGA